MKIKYEDLFEDGFIQVGQTVVEIREGKNVKKWNWVKKETK